MLLTRTNYNASAAQVRTQAQTYSHIQEIRNFLSADTFSSVLQVDSSKGERREFLKHLSFSPSQAIGKETSRKPRNKDLGPKMSRWPCLSILVIN